MNTKDITRVYFLGIGGIGMSALARYFLQQGLEVFGYDKTPSPLTTELSKEGAHIIFEDQIASIPKTILQKDTLFVYTPAIPKNNTIKTHIEKQGFNWFKRSEVLGLLSKQFKCISIAGTHGKTTISSMTAHIVHQSHLGCQAFLGGILKNYSSNMLQHKNSEFMVVEADEYDRSFLQLNPHATLISAMDADHLDIYGTHEELIRTFKEFADKTQSTDLLLVHQNLKHYFSHKTLSYSLDNTDSDYYASSIELVDGSYHFNLIHPAGEIKNIVLQMPGMINLENAIGAAALSIMNGVKEEEIRNGIGNFKGIRRRMERLINKPNFVYYDDYAHHPDEINAALSSIKLMHPDKEICVVFQPHLFSRTQDFANGFAQSLDQAHSVVLLDIYPAREEAIPGVSSQIILDKMQLKKKAIIAKDELIEQIEQNKIDILVTLGAGDIDRLVEPLKKHFS